MRVDYGYMFGKARRMSEALPNMLEHIEEAGTQ